MKYENLSKKVQVSVNKKNSSNVNSESSMDVKNLVVFKPISKFQKFKTYSITFVLPISIAFSGIAIAHGVSNYFYQKNIVNNNSDTSIVQYDDSYSIVGTEKIFQVGEHVISIPLGDKTAKEIKQYDNYEGYKCEGVFNKDTESAYIKYVNVEPVKCNVSHYDEKGNYLYLDFGSPVELENSKTR